MITLCIFPVAGSKIVTPITVPLPCRQFHFDSVNETIWNSKKRQMTSLNCFFTVAGSAGLMIGRRLHEMRKNASIRIANHCLGAMILFIPLPGTTLR